jgi:hypothetical protein
LRAKRRLREGGGSEIEVRRLRAKRMAIRADLAELGEYADAAEPGEE